MRLNDRFERLAQSLLKPINPATVIFLGLYTVVWGLWVASPFWTVFTQAALYSVLGSLAPEWFWGYLAIYCGLSALYGAFKRSYRALIVGSTVACWHWSMISIFYFLGDPLNTGGITALAFALYAAFTYLNLRVNFGKQYRIKRLLKRA